MELKLLIFDFDGVLADTSKVHLNALNKSIAEINPDPKFQISDHDDAHFFGTVPTKTKLEILSSLRNFPTEQHSQVHSLKKTKTLEMIDSLPLETFFLPSTKTLIETLHKEYTLYICSNTNIDFINKVLDRANITHLFSGILTNSSARSKPCPDLYWHAMMKANVLAEETMIFEDSVTGQEGAIRSGANVYGVEKPSDLTYDKVKSKILALKPKRVKWKSEKINVLIPMAGEGSRFKEAGYETPKPIIDVNGTPMVGLVADYLNIDANFIFVVKGEHCQQYNLETMLQLMKPGCTVVKTWGKQAGAAASVLEAKSFINNDEHLLIVNSDQVWDWKANVFYYQTIKEDLDGWIVTFEDLEKNPKWSFAKTDGYGYVTEVAEKNPISTSGTAGIYYFNKGSDFVKYAELMIEKDIRVNNEFYVCPVFNEFIQDGKKIKTFDVDKMWGLGIPQDLETYLLQHKK